FSFSGLKTAVRHEAERIAPLSEQDVADLCAAFQAAARDVVTDRVARALERFCVEREVPSPVLVVAGGVAANATIRAALAEVAAAVGGRLVAPPPALCADNGAMVAWAAAERLALGLSDALDAPARPRWPLSEVAVAKTGAVS